MCKLQVGVAVGRGSLYSYTQAKSSERLLGSFFALSIILIIVFATFAFGCKHQGGKLLGRVSCRLGVGESVWAKFAICGLIWGPVSSLQVSVWLSHRTIHHLHNDHQTISNPPKKLCVCQFCQSSGNMLWVFLHASSIWGKLGAQLDDTISYLGASNLRESRFSRILKNFVDISLLNLDLEAFSFHFFFSISILRHFHFTFHSRNE